MPKPDIKKTIQEIFDLYHKRNFSLRFTYESIADIFELGNEVFMRNKDVDIDKFLNRPNSDAPDLLDDEPFSFERTFLIYRKLEDKYSEVNTELIRKVFEANSKIAWKEYRKKYDKYILELFPLLPNDEYINYLAGVIYYERKEYYKALKCINLAIIENGSSSLYTHLKGLCLMNSGEFESARTYFYQALFLRELNHDIMPKMVGKQEIYPNYPVEYKTSVKTIRASLKQLDFIEDSYTKDILPIIES